VGFEYPGAGLSRPVFETPGCAVAGRCVCALYTRACNSSATRHRSVAARFDTDELGKSVAPCISFWAKVQALSRRMRKLNW
jgi:hypothetical protein